MATIILDIEIDQSQLRGLRRAVPRIMKRLLQDTAQEWHDSILRQHFVWTAARRYHHSPRSPFYRDVIKKRDGRGQGRYVDLWQRGKSRRYMWALYKVTGTQRRATLRMKAPIYFKHPFVGVVTDQKTGQQRRITKQPNKPKELTAIDTADRVHLRRFADRRLQRLLQHARMWAAAGGGGGGGGPRS